MVSTLQNTLEFLKSFGFFDVIVPFLLFFAIIFAILEKTRLLGREKSNVNLIVALAVALLAVAANKIVGLISSVIPNLLLVLVLFMMFVMILGLFFKDEELEFSSKHKNWFKFFMFLLFILTIAFILNAWPTDSGTMLEKVLDSIQDGSSGELVGGVILLLIVIGAVFVVAKSKRGSQEET